MAAILLNSTEFTQQLVEAGLPRVLAVPVLQAVLVWTTPWFFRECRQLLIRVLQG